MIAVLFEVTLKSSHKEQYFNIAASLKANLSEVEGFISVERFQSLTDTNKYLSLSFWQDELAIQNWKQNESHKLAQEIGQKAIFDHYRIRVGQIIRDYNN